MITIVVQFNSVISRGDHNTDNSDSNEGCEAKKISMEVNLKKKNPKLNKYFYSGYNLFIF